MPHPVMSALQATPAAAGGGGITFVDYSTGVSVGSADPGLPAGIADGDLLLYMHTCQGSQYAALAAPSAHWAEVGTEFRSGTGTNADKVGLAVYWEVYDSGDPPTTASTDTGSYNLVAIAAFRGVDQTTPIHATQETADSSNDTSFLATGVTTSVDGCMIVVVGSHGDNAALHSSWANADLASITEAFDVDTMGGSDGTLTMAYGIDTTAGTVGNTTATIAVSEEEANRVIALEPA